MMVPDPAQVYTPAEDTFLLLEAARKEIRYGDRVIEVGTGSGAVASDLDKSSLLLIATDINPHATFQAHLKGIMVLRTDLLSGVRGPFDLILFNPPYLPTMPGERIDDWLEYALDGGETGRDVIERFLADAGRVLALNGRILLLISSLTDLQKVIEMAGSNGYTATITEERAVEDEILYVLRLVRHDPDAKT